MSQRPRIIIAQRQRLALNANLSASIRLLRSDTAGLTRYLEEQAAENPHVRLVGPEPAAIGDWLPRWSGVLAVGRAGQTAASEPASAQPSLIAHVVAAVQALALPRVEHAIALALLEALEPSGWLGRPLAEIAVELGHPATEVEAVLQRLQKIDPPGLFARNLAECLALQVEDLGKLDREMAVMLNHLDLLASGGTRRLAQLCGCDEAGIAQRFRLIRTLNPKPGAGFSTANPAEAREPDLLARPLQGGRWQVALNRSALPTVEVSGTGGEDGAANPAGLQAAKALQHMVEARNDTLLRVGREIVTRQAEALALGPGALRPMVMADLAEALGLHVSTISRVVAGASLDGPTGVWWLRQMFSAARGAAEAGQEAMASDGVSVAALRHRLGRLIATEPRAAPLSDAALADRLAAETGVRLARRTIAQYRAAEGFPAAHRRRLRPLKARRKTGTPKDGQV